MTIGAFLAVYYSAGIIYDFEDTVSEANLPPVDVLVVLAGAKGRIAEASDLWYRYWEKNPNRTPVFYVSGMGPQADWSVLEQQIRPQVIQALDPARVVLETHSEDTKENAHWFARYAYRHGWRHMMLVTSSYHMKRARYIFERVVNAPIQKVRLPAKLAQANAEEEGGLAEARAVPTPADLEVTEPHPPEKVRIDTFTIYHEGFQPDRWQQDAYSVRVTIIEFIKWVYYRTYW